MAHSDGGGDTEVSHPAQVAELLSARGYGDDVIAAALLHDVVEDTAIPLERIAERFGPDIARLVEVLTEDETILSYPERKREHRARVAAAGEPAAAIFAADKVAKLRAAADGRRSFRPEQLDHYAETLADLQAAHPTLPFLPELQQELATLD